MVSIVEAIVGNPISTPRHFWLVLDIPNRAASDDDTKAHHDRILTGLAKGQLDGVRGVSDTKVILTDWWLMCRNAAIMMDADKVIALNDIEQMPYHDPEALVANNLKALHRLFSKEQDTKANRYGVMLNIMQYLIRIIDKNDHRLGHSLQYYGAASIVADEWGREARPVETVRDLAEHIFNILTTVGKRQLDHVMTDLAAQDFFRPVREAIAHCGQMYKGEGEWVVHGEHFAVPPKSIMLVGVDLSILNSMDKWYNRDPNDLLGFISTEWRYANTERLLQAIEKYRLRDFYTLKFVDSDRFENLRGELVGRRRIRDEKTTGQ